MEEDLNILKVEDLSNHWSDLPHILNIIKHSWAFVETNKNCPPFILQTKGFTIHIMKICTQDRNIQPLTRYVLVNPVVGILLSKLEMIMH